jgi:hypothetical protein
VFPERKTTSPVSRKPSNLARGSSGEEALGLIFAYHAAGQGWLCPLTRFNCPHSSHVTLSSEKTLLAQPPDPDIAPGDGLLIRPPSASGELAIVAKAENVSLNGNFEVTIRLTKDEIANLARIAFAENSFAEVVDALSRGTPLKASKTLCRFLATLNGWLSLNRYS